MSSWRKKPWEIKKKSAKTSLLFFSLVNFLWLVFRTGTKPSRVTYPCQRAAADNLSIGLSTILPIPIAAAFTATFAKANTFFAKNKSVIFAFSLIAVMSGGLLGAGIFWRQPNSSSQELQLTLDSQTATVFPASDIYLVNGPTAAHINELINLMGLHDLFFYQSSIVGTNRGPVGLIAHDDVVLIKINEQWDQRGGTNTDALKELIQAIVDHPDGFVGEVVVADNGQGRGNMNWDNCNAEDNDQSTEDVVNMFSLTYNVSIYDWQPIRGYEVDEYSEEDMRTGYILYDNADPETGIYVSYPKFTTAYGTRISFKYGIWNGTGYENRLKIINMPTLKSHSVYGVTATLKNYMGVQSEREGIGGGLANGHSTVGTGGMGTLMVETGLPTLNLIDAIWINANPSPSSSCGPSTSYNEATRVNVLIAGLDPVAIDYWAAKHVLIQAAKLIGYDESDTQPLDPESTVRGNLAEAFGVYLNRTKDEILRGGYEVTSDEDRMNVYVHPDSGNLTNQTSTSSIISPSGPPDSASSSNSSSQAPGFGIVGVIFGLGLGVSGVAFLRRQRKK